MLAVPVLMITFPERSRSSRSITHVHKYVRKGDGHKHQQYCYQSIPGG